MSAEKLSEDLTEAETLIASVKSSRIKAVLENLAKELKSEQAAATKNDDAQSDESPPEAPPAPAPAPADPEYKTNDAPPSVNSNLKFVSIEGFGWDQGEYGSPKVTVYVTKGMEGVGQVKKNVTCSFTKEGFDLVIEDFKGKNYRLCVDNLEHEIIPEDSKVVVKANKVLVKLVKKKGEYSYDHWTELRSKKNADEKRKLKNDPTSGIMDMMKKMYDEGDDTMKKTIGEAMQKSQQKQANPGLDDDGLGM